MHPIFSFVAFSMEILKVLNNGLWVSLWSLYQKVILL